MRGIAATIMLQGHTFDNFASPATRQGATYIFSQFIGGEAAALFLFLTGVTYGLGMNRRQHLQPWERVKAALARARYLFLLAIAFRVASFAFSYPHSSVRDLLKVDVLNLMGLTAAVISVLALFGGLDRVRWAGLVGVGIAALSPLAKGIANTPLPDVLKWYLVPSADMFSLFPWGSYLVFGMAAGSAIPLIDRNSWGRVMQWSALVGFGLLIAGRFFGDLPFSIYTDSNFWLDSPALVACKMGIIFLIAAASFLWTEYLSPDGFSWVRTLGTNSLLVYVVHIQLVYGRWFNDYNQRWDTRTCILFSACLIVSMIGMCVGVKRVPWSELLESIGIHFGKRHPHPAEVVEMHPATDAEIRRTARRRL